MYIAETRERVPKTLRPKTNIQNVRSIPIIKIQRNRTCSEQSLESLNVPVCKIVQLHILLQKIGLQFQLAVVALALLAATRTHPAAPHATLIPTSSSRTNLPVSQLSQTSELSMLTREDVIEIHFLDSFFSLSVFRKTKTKNRRTKEREKTYNFTHTS
jgi:hypothetical protein